MLPSVVQYLRPAVGLDIILRGRCRIFAAKPRSVKQSVDGMLCHVAKSAPIRLQFCTHHCAVHPLERDSTCCTEFADCCNVVPPTKGGGWFWGVDGRELSETSNLSLI